jgi:hypothetical protein
MLELEKEKFPSFSKWIDELNNIFPSLEKRKINRVSPRGNPIIPKVVWKFQVYLQLSIYRVTDLCLESCQAWQREKPAVSFLLMRSLMENAAVIYDMALKTKMYLGENDLDKISDLIDNRAFGTKLFENMPKTINLLTAIDNVTKKDKGFRPTYEFISEFCHPTYSSLTGLYGKLNKEGIYFDVGNKWGTTEAVFAFFIDGLTSSMIVFVRGIEMIEDLFPSLLELNNLQTKK